MEISAQSIQIQKGQGLTQALRAKVGKDVKISAQQWDKTIDVLAKINEQRKEAGASTIFTGGTDKSKAGYHTSFVVQPNQKIDFSKDEMAAIYSAMGLSIASETSEEVDKTDKLEEAAPVEEKSEQTEVKNQEGTAPLTKEEKKALKAKRKQEKAHDEAAIDTTVPRKTEHRSKAQKKFTKANKALISMAYSIQKPYIKEGVKVVDGEEYTYKTAKFSNAADKNTWLDKASAEARKLLYGGSRYVTVLYNKAGEAVAIEINSDRTRKNSAPDVKYTKDAAYADTKRKQDGYEVKITEGFDFDAVKAVTDKIFAKESK